MQDQAVELYFRGCYNPKKLPNYLILLKLEIPPCNNFIGLADTNAQKNLGKEYLFSRGSASPEKNF